MSTVETTVSSNLCTSCGICKAVCPKNCIKYERSNGLYVPVIDKKVCVDCGKCYQVCPGKGFDYTKYDTFESADFWEGDYQSIYSASTKEVSRLQNAVSGGVVTELVYNLLESGEYKAAFLIQTHQYTEHIVETECVTKDMDLSVTQKSRYLTVSQEKAVSYMLTHRDDKVILVGTSCFVQGILNVMEAYKLNRDNYFIIGLFCDKTMTLNVVDYFSKHPALKGKELDSMYFRSKEVGGWPGGVRLDTTDGQQVDLPNTERMKVKEYFQPEKCLYCLDKLNKYADISVGDNYTKENSDKRGSSSVIVRTAKGANVWEQYASKFDWQESSIEKIRKSQHLHKRKDNLKFAVLKETKLGTTINTIGNQVAVEKISWKTKLQYSVRLLKVKVGAQYEKHPGYLSCFLLWKNFKLAVKGMLKRSS